MSLIKMKYFIINFYVEYFLTKIEYFTKLRSNILVFLTVEYISLRSNSFARRIYFVCSLNTFRLLVEYFLLGSNIFFLHGIFCLQAANIFFNGIFQPLVRLAQNIPLGIFHSEAVRVKYFTHP